MDKVFGIKQAIQEIASGNKVKMKSVDFKTHVFYKSNNNYKPIIHNVRRSIGGPIDLHLTYDEFKDKFGENKFYLYEDLV